MSVDIHESLISDLKERTSCFSPLSMMLAIVFFVDTLYEVQEFPVYS